MKSPAKNHVFRHDDEVSESGGSDTHSDLFFCGLALDGARGLFYEFHWENHRKIAMQDGSPSEKSWHVDVQGLSRWKGIAQGAEAGKAFAENSDNGTDDSFYEDNEQQTSDIHESVAGGEETSDRESFLEGDDLVSSTSKKRRGAQKGRSSPDLTTYKRRKMAVPTPHSKAALRARQRTKDRGKGNMSGKRHNFTTHLPRAATDYAKLQNLPPDPFLRAMHVLHVGARPEVLPCREDEYVEVMGGILDLVEEGSGGCVCNSISSVHKGNMLIFPISRRHIRCARIRQDCNSPCCRERINGDGRTECASRSQLACRSLLNSDFFIGNKPIHLCRNKWIEDSRTLSGIRTPLGSCIWSRRCNRGSPQN